MFRIKKRKTYDTSKSVDEINEILKHRATHTAEYMQEKDSQLITVLPGNILRVHNGKLYALYEIITKDEGKVEIVERNTSVCTFMSVTLSLVSLCIIYITLVSETTIIGVATALYIVIMIGWLWYILSVVLPFRDVEKFVLRVLC